MKVEIKKGLCIVNTMLAFVAYSLFHAHIWLGRIESEGTWLLYIDNDSWFMCLTFCALILAFWSMFWNPTKSRISYFICAVPNIVFVTAVIVLYILHGAFTIEEFKRGWKVFASALLYLAVAILYFVMAFTKIKEHKREEVPIPYSE